MITNVFDDIRMDFFVYNGVGNMHNNELFRWHICGLSIKETMELTGRCEATIRKWDAGRKIPEPIKRLMAYHAGLRAPGNHPEWKGWRIRREFLITPENEWITIRELRAALYLLRMEKTRGRF